MIVEIVFSVIFVMVLVFVARAFQRSGKEEQLERQLDQQRKQWFSSKGGQYTFAQQRRRASWHKYTTVTRNIYYSTVTFDNPLS